MHNNKCLVPCLYSVGTCHRNLLKLCVTISRVICFIPQGRQAHIVNCVSQK